MLEGLLSYDSIEDIWFLIKDDGAKLDVSAIVYNLSALGLDDKIDENKQVKFSIGIKELD